jgi:hypothetical protein
VAAKKNSFRARSRSFAWHLEALDEFAVPSVVIHADMQVRKKYDAQINEVGDVTKACRDGNTVSLPRA